MSSRGCAQRGAHDDHTESFLYELRLLVGRSVATPLTYYEQARLRRDASRVRRLYPIIAAAVMDAEDPRSLPIALYVEQIEKARRTVRIVPKCDADLEHVGHVCGPARDADLALLRSIA